MENIGDASNETVLVSGDFIVCSVVDVNYEIIDALSVVLGAMFEFKLALEWYTLLCSSLYVGDASVSIFPRLSPCVS